MNTVRRCIDRYLNSGINIAVFDDERSGRPAEITDDAKSWIVSIACQKPCDLGYAAELWTLAALHKHIQVHAEEAGYPRLKMVTKPWLQKYLKKMEIKPFKIKYYLERKDPDFENKMHDVLLVYKQMEMQLDDNGNIIIPDNGHLTHTISYKEYFADYYLHVSDVTFDFTEQNKMQIHNNVAEPWKVTLVDTGLETMTGGRIKRIQKYIPEGETFLMTYGDGVSDVDIDEFINFHNEKNAIVTMTIIQPDGRYGAVDVDIESGKVKSFVEKPVGDGGYFVLDYRIFEYLKEDTMVFEKEPLEKLAELSALSAYKHCGYWQLMDSLRDKNTLEDVWKSGEHRGKSGKLILAKGKDRK